MQYRWFLRPPLFGARCSVLALSSKAIITWCGAIRQALLSKYFRPSSWAGKNSAIENILKISGEQSNSAVSDGWPIVVGFYYMRISPPIFY
jgi:hypothetical protein